MITVGVIGALSEEVRQLIKILGNKKRRESAL